MAGTRKSTVQQVTVHLTSEEVEFLKTQAGIDGVSFNDVLRRSIILEKFFVDQQRKKRKISLAHRTSRSEKLSDSRRPMTLRPLVVERSMIRGRRDPWPTRCVGIGGCGLLLRPRVADSGPGRRTVICGRITLPTSSHHVGLPAQVGVRPLKPNAHGGGTAPAPLRDSRDGTPDASQPADVQIRPLPERQNW
ncbi:MAG: hypothetical protein OXC12_00065 [Spirochaetaceae bacterium]|nr:hypothetical protein [Spirochaetaceae bacterium]